MPASRDIEILNLVNAIVHQATARMQRSLREAEVGLAAMEARTLRFIARHPACTQNDIVRESGRDKAQVARIVKTLIERDNVRRLPDEAGQKRQRLAVTASGESTHETAEGLRAAVARDLLADLSAAERAQLHKLLARMAQAPPDPT